MIHSFLEQAGPSSALKMAKIVFSPHSPAYLLLIVRLASSTVLLLQTCLAFVQHRHSKSRFYPHFNQDNNVLLVRLLR